MCKIKQNIPTIWMWWIKKKRWSQTWAKYVLIKSWIQSDANKGKVGWTWTSIWNSMFPQSVWIERAPGEDWSTQCTRDASNEDFALHPLSSSAAIFDGLFPSFLTIFQSMLSTFFLLLRSTFRLSNLASQPILLSRSTLLFILRSASKPHAMRSSMQEEGRSRHLDLKKRWRMNGEPHHIHLKGEIYFSCLMPFSD